MKEIKEIVGCEGLLLGDGLVVDLAPQVEGGKRAGKVFGRIVSVYDSWANV